MSHNSLGTSYCRIPAKRTGISRKTSAFIAGRNGADREVPACFARGGTGRYGTLKVKHLRHQKLRSLDLLPTVLKQQMSLMLEHKRSVQHNKDGRRVECGNTRRGYKANWPSYLSLVDYNA